MNIFSINFLCIFGGLLLLIACTSNPIRDPVHPIRDSVHWTLDAATDIEKKYVRARVLDQLKDPNSAIFGKIWALNGSNGSRYICGFVNAKNSFGGYTGDSMFLVMPTDGYVSFQEGWQESLFPEICRERTVT